MQTTADHGLIASFVSEKPSNLLRGGKGALHTRGPRSMWFNLTYARFCQGVG